MAVRYYNSDLFKKIKNTHKHMMGRCYNKRHSSYNHYGGRGIDVCKRWHDCGYFFNDVIIGCDFNLQLDRIDNNKGYYPDNVRWVTHKQNQRNKRNSVFILSDGINQTVSEWVEDTGLNYFSIISRLNRGFKGEEALYGKKLKELMMNINTPKETEYYSVIKIAALGKEYIGRAINFSSLEDELRYVYRRYKIRNALPPTNQYYSLVKYISDNKINSLDISIIFSLKEENKADGYLLLKEEYKALIESKLSGNNINDNNEPIVPKFKTDKKPSKWLTHNQYLNFKKFIKRQTEQV